MLSRAPSSFPKRITLGFCKNKDQGYLRSERRGSPIPDGAHPIPLAHMSSGQPPCYWGAEDETQGSRSVLVESASPHPSRDGAHVPESCSRPAQREEGPSQDSQIPGTLVKTQKHPRLPPSSGSDRSLTPAIHMDRSTHSLPSCPTPCSPLSLAAAVHLLVPSAPVRPAICLHTFGGNLWASLQSWPNPSCPQSLSA